MVSVFDVVLVVGHVTLVVEFVSVEFIGDSGFIGFEDLAVDEFVNVVVGVDVVGDVLARWVEECATNDESLDDINFVLFLRFTSED